MEQKIKDAYRQAIKEIKNNITFVPNYDKPVLVEGGQYKGVWMEGGLQAALICRNIDPQIMKNTHELFFDFQKEDGQFPAVVAQHKVYWGQIQMVVPIASTSLQVYQLTHDTAFLRRAYACCVKWDGWLEKNRLNGTYYLCKMFCDWDTGHDQSQRTHDLPQECPNIDAKIMPDLSQLPLYAPDLSATIYSGRKALAEIAFILGKIEERKEWLIKANKIKEAIRTYCYDEESAWCYDIYEDGSFRKIMGDAGLRVLQEHALEEELAKEVIRKNVLDPNKFWTAYPLPSVAVSDPLFPTEFKRNHWDGSCQGLLTLRTLRWFDYYGFEKEHKHLMKQFVKAIIGSFEEERGIMKFTQQINPLTGEVNSTEEYTPALVAFVEFIWRLYPEEFPQTFYFSQSH